MENNDTEKELFRIQRMLEQVTGIQKTHRQLAAATGSRFNIFEILEKQKKEVAICRMMYELLSPDGSHGQGSCYLRLFFTHVLKQEVSETMLRTAVVYREYCTADNRRIDLVIETADRFIPIEVKIDAGDQPTQCADYYQEAVQSGKQVTLYYLTKYGDAPSEYSISRTHREQSAIETISFAAEIQNWLLACLQLPETIRLAPVREVLLQFLATVKAFTNQMEEKERMEIQDILMASADNMRSAVAIKQTVEAAQRTMLNRFFAAVDAKVGVHYKRLENEYDYAYHNGKRVEDFYKYRRYTMPGISYLFQENVKPGVDLWVRLEICEYGYLGYYCPQECIQGTNPPLTAAEVKQLTGITYKEDSDDQGEGWWAYWENYPDEVHCPAFKDIDDNYFALFDQAYFDQVVDQCAARMLELLRYQK